ncbi:MAG: aminotransferase class I/II-fold pyridoxal phosphate-dependent enzyme [SAR202 cluster bacterium]|nr:aminotransferase class I/II-fold pyridoxal phosphate-dependent enzyme [SAR202 cluster bacterium]
MRSIESICATAGEDVPSDTRPLTAPIYQNSVFEVDSLEQIDAIYRGATDGYLYSREFNPNVMILEDVMAQLEGGDDAVAFSSGMAAIGGTLLSLVKAGDRIVAGSDLYGGTNVLLRQHLSRLGVETEFVDFCDLTAVRRAFDDQPELALIESITNPLLRMPDIKAISKIAAMPGVRIVVDNTLATPLLMRPLRLGADVVLHSTTKSLGGHSDVTGGVAVANFDLTMDIHQSARVWGSVPDPFAAWLTVRGIRTLPLRVDRACENAMAVAQFLSARPEVSQAHYPGLPDHPQHKLARKTLGGRFGWMISVDLAGGLQAASSFVKALEMIKLAPSLGETRTTISHPAKTSHRSLSPEERVELGIGDGLIRMSCGIESAADIVADIEQALRKT